MPAMSPTMEKGGIVEWKVKEGEHFSAGDVLLEVETDKAQIDVEAQDDGVLAKIVKQNGEKDIPVGEPIGFLAEADEDYSGVDFALLVLKSAPKSAPEPEKTVPEPKKEAPKPSQAAKPASGALSGPADPNQTLFPSVLMLLASANISPQQAFSKIPASGAAGRLLKGDVLLYLGKISPENASRSLEFFKKHEKLELPASGEVYKPLSAASEPKKEPKPEKKQPVVLSETFSLEKLDLGKHASTEKYIANAVAKAEAYALQLHPVKSDYYDELFEEILQVKGERFSVEYSVSHVVEFKVTLVEKFDDAKEKASLFLKELSTYFA